MAPGGQSVLLNAYQKAVEKFQQTQVMVTHLTVNISLKDDTKIPQELC